MPALIPKMTVTPAAKNIYEHSLNTQEYAKLDSNRKKLKRALKVRFNERLDVESDIAAKSFSNSCVSILYKVAIIYSFISYES